MEKKDSLSLKWETLESWDLHGEKALVLLKQYIDIGVKISVMTQHDTPEQKELICRIIDETSADTVYLDWAGVDVSKEEAKKYVREYSDTR